jgi:hypothetical protein
MTIKGTESHIMRILQANQKKIEQQEVFLLPSQKKLLAKMR